MPVVVGLALLTFGQTGSCEYEHSSRANEVTTPLPAGGEISSHPGELGAKSYPAQGQSTSNEISNGPSQPEPTTDNEHMNAANDHDEVTTIDRLLTWAQYPLPQHGLSRLVHWFTRLELGPLTRLMIRAYVWRYGIDLDEVAETDLKNYSHFNAFFTRALRPEARPIAGGEQTLVSPVDGTVSQAGAIDGNQIIQAKGHHYSVEALLGSDTDLARRFHGGQFATIYLSPRDYHRIHMPIAGQLQEMIHVPGRLFSVNPATTRTLPNLFARNERVISIFNGDDLDIAMVLVGATMVGSIETAWAGEVTPPTRNRIRRWHYGEKEPSITLAKGVEMGRFNMGSTVILLFRPGQVKLDLAKLAPGERVVMGESIGRTDHRASQPR